jgi:type I restriction enzyme S subunit
MTKAWTLAKLSEVLQPVSRRERVDPTKRYRLLGIRLDGVGPFHRETIQGSQSAATFLYKVRTGDFIYSRLFACRGAFGVIGSDLDGCYVSEEFPTFVTIDDRVDVNFLKLWFRLPMTIRKVDSNCTGSTPLTRNRFKENFFLNLDIPLPPVTEQRWVVARIGELAAKIEEAHRLRQQAAIQVDAIIPNVSKNLFDPLTCERKPLKEVAEKKTGVAYKADDFINSGNVPVVRLKEIITKTPVVYLRNPEAYVNVWLEAGDIVLAKTSFSTGSMCLWTGPRAVLNQNAVMLRVREGVEQKYLFIWLAQQVTRHMNDQLADPNFYPYIREADLMQWLVPVPSIPEQRQFVAYFNRVVERVELLKQVQANTAAEIDALLPSILDKAFKGEL